MSDELDQKHGQVNTEKRNRGKGLESTKLITCQVAKPDNCHCALVLGYPSAMADVLQEDIRMKRVLAGPLSELQETAKHIAHVSNECKLPLSPDEYVETFKPTLMDVVHAWSKVGLAFFACHNIPTALHIRSYNRRTASSVLQNFLAIWQTAD